MFLMPLVELHDTRDQLRQLVIESIGCTQVNCEAYGLCHCQAELCMCVCVCVCVCLCMKIQYRWYTTEQM